MKFPLTIAVLLFLSANVRGEAFRTDLSQYRSLPGLEAESRPEELIVSWRGEGGSPFRVRFGIDRGTPVVRKIETRTRGGWNVLGHNLTPEFGVTTGFRRTGHGLPEENRWDVYWDAPLSTTNRDEVRSFRATFNVSSCQLKTDGARLEITFPGVFMGFFTGNLQFTVYRDSNLLREEIVAMTDMPSLAYKYYGGLDGFALEDADRLLWRDLGGNLQNYFFGGTPNENVVPLRARNRLAVVGGRAGSIAFFPPPHQFFFARQLEVNLGFVWYRKEGADHFSIGIRQGDSAEGYNPTWIEKVFALYNAPPGTWQHMPVYFYLSAQEPENCRQAALALTHHDRFKPLPGYKTLVTHFHTAFTQELTQAGNLDVEPAWIPAMRALGINMVYLCDFHGDGHPGDPGPIRAKELLSYFEACRRHSDRDFLILPGEEPNAYLGGHYNILFPRPVVWTHVRKNGAPFEEQVAGVGNVYHVGNAEEMFELMKRENGLVWQTHPRTKGSTFYPDRIRDMDYFKSDLWLGAGFKALPVDLSQKRLGEVRCFGTLDDMNNWGRPKYLIAEVDTYKKFPEYDLYGDFNVNYVKLERLPGQKDWSELNRALRAGQFFVSTGEVLIPNSNVTAAGQRISVDADVEWTFPLEFVEAVWGDGETVGREIVSATELPQFGRKHFHFELKREKKKWVRFAAWDSAGNGAFTQPVHL